MNEDTRFSDLHVGDTFDFVAPTGYNSFFNLCVKISPRKYAWAGIGGTLSTSVGSIHVKVYHVNESPFTPHR